MKDSEIPIAAVNDAVMAPKEAVNQVQDWATQVFGVPVPPQQAPEITVTVRRQDFNVLRFGQSCMETPITIGTRSFKHGLGTHANSEIAITLPKNAIRFHSWVGIDNNYDTAGTRGSVQFSLEANGQELYKTDVLEGGQEPVEVNIDIPADTSELILKVDTTPDGPAYDQADWADAQVELADGSFKWLDENQWDCLLSPGDVPFSFTYNGKSSRDILKSWKQTVQTTKLDGETQYEICWLDPETQLAVTAVAKVFDQYPAVDWVLYFENRGTADTPIIENIQALNTTLRTGNSKRAAIVHYLHGDVCGEQTFIPGEIHLEVGKSQHFQPDGGRPSNGSWPFYNLEYDNAGIIAAIGWSGQWATNITRTPNGPTNLQAGMELTHLLLHPGEKIRSPRILLLQWQGDRIAAHNRFRRLLMYHYVPKVNGAPARLPVASQCFDRYSWSVPEWATEQGQIEAVAYAKKLGCDTHWLDAAWFVGGFPNGVGNWFCKPKEFPNGLKPVGDACNATDMKFVLWYEPERIAPGTQVATEFPEFVHGGANGGLFKLDDPAARRWLTDLLSSQISEFGIDIYRNDFNIDPLGFWRQNDTEDRQGMTEIRYVEGHYEMWDELRAKHPGMLIDNCASGGRRIDIETISRSVPLWRSDTSCSPGHSDWNQSQSYGLSLYIPLHTACGWTPEPYDFRSSATGGAICQWDYRNPTFPLELAQATIAEAKENQKYWYGDFYPLMGCSTSADHWMAYQFHRADLDSGIVYAFRRSNSAYLAINICLQALNVDGKYNVEFIGDDRQPVVKQMTGAELMNNYELRMAKKGSSLLIRYSPTQ